MKSSIMRFVTGGAALVGLPMLGVWVAGYDLTPYLEFPPRTLHVKHADFSWLAFALLAVIEVAAILYAIRAGIRGSGTAPAGQPKRFPWWGWAGIAWLIPWWILAWSRFDWFAPLQPHTFTPLWFGYIVIINGLTYRRSGRCLLTHDTAYLLKLFPASAAFWWFFEYLNRFVQNWTYVGVQNFSPLVYFLFATAAFSTVLPAVMSTTELLHTWGFASRADDRPPIAPKGGWRIALLIISLVALFFLGLAPNYLFPFLWLAPLGLVIFVQPLNAPFQNPKSKIQNPQPGTHQRTTSKTKTTPGCDIQSLENFHRIFPTVGTLLRLSMAALICGFFWELWNWHSLAKWIYHVPFVQTLHVFEMPLPGYFGYLPFGWECAWIAGMIRERKQDGDAEAVAHTNR